MARISLLSGRSVVLLILILCIVLLFPLLGYCPVSASSEAREGSVVIEILRTGEYILPRRNGQVIPSKPILFHLIGAALARVLGYYDEFVLRLPSAFAGTGVVLCVAILARQLAGPAAGLLSAAVLLSNFGFVHLSMDGRVDMVFCLFLTWAIMLWIAQAARVYEKDCPPTEIPDSVYHFVGILTGFAVLTKGPLGLALSFLAISAMAFWHWKWLGLRSVLRPGWIWAAVISLPWYAMATLAGRHSFIVRQIVFENLRRLSGGEGIRTKPILYYFTHFWDQGAPWSIVLLAYMLALAWVHLQRPASGWACKVLVHEKRSVRFGVACGLVYFGSIIVFLSLAAGKRSAYLVPTFPAMALVLSLALTTCFESLSLSGERGRLFCSGFKRCGYTVWLLTMIFLAGITVVGYAQPVCITDYRTIVTFRSMPQVIAQAPGRLVSYLALFSLCSVLFWHKGFSKKNLPCLAVALVCYLQLVFVVIVQVGMALKGATHTYRDYAQQLQSFVPAGAILHVLKDAEDESLDSFFFYYRREIELIEPERGTGEDGYYLARRWWLEELPQPLWSEKVHVLTSGRTAIETEPRDLVVFYFGNEKPGEKRLRDAY
jgi:4-amino-4-deoxy-L-arabinose transferase-like glycosyltransferase